jgi:hypothetical protein
VALLTKNAESEHLPYFVVVILDVGSWQSAVDVLHWDEDHVAWALTDHGFAFVDVATFTCSVVMSSYTLYVTLCSQKGLASVQNILHQSHLEHLRVQCVSIPDELWHQTSRVLASMQWSSVKSLALTGTNIDEWILLWSKEGHLFSRGSDLSSPGPQLLHLEINGAGSIANVSHASMLSIHHLIYSCPLVELHMEHCSVDEKDQALVDEACTNQGAIRSFGSEQNMPMTSQRNRERN